MEDKATLTMDELSQILRNATRAIELRYSTWLLMVVLQFIASAYIATNSIIRCGGVGLAIALIVSMAKWTRPDIQSYRS